MVLFTLTHAVMLPKFPFHLYTLRVGVSRSEQTNEVTRAGVPTCTVKLAAIPATDLQLLVKYFFEEQTPFTDLVGGLEHYKYFCTDRNWLNEIDKFLQDYGIGNKMLIYYIIGLAANAALYEHLPKNSSITPLKRNRYAERNKQQKDLEKWKKNGEGRIQQLIELNLVDDENETAESYFLEKATFRFRSGQGKVETVQLSDYYEINLILRMIAGLAGEVAKYEGYDQFIQNEFGVSVSALNESRKIKQARAYAFCKGFVDMVWNEKIGNPPSKDHIFQVFYELFLLCGYEKPTIHQKCEPKKTIRHWYNRAK